MIFNVRKEELENVMTKSHEKIIKAIHEDDLDTLTVERAKYSEAYEEFCGMLLSQNMELSDDISALVNSLQ